MKMKINIILIYLITCISCVDAMSNISFENDCCTDSMNKTIALRPIYFDEGTLEENVTTDECEYDWNQEHFSYVWPKSRKSFLDFLCMLESIIKKRFDNLHVIAVLPLSDADAFKANVETLYESMTVCCLLDIPLAISIASKSHPVRITPSNVGPFGQSIRIYGDGVEWISDKERGKENMRLTFNEAKRILDGMDLISKKPDIYLEWHPDRTNVDFLLYSLKIMKEQQIRYSFKFCFSLDENV